MWTPNGLLRLAFGTGEKYGGARVRKRMIRSADPIQRQLSEEKWLTADEIAEVEVTSEDPDFPVEFALVPGKEGPGWRAAEQGEQVVRLILDPARALRHIRLSFLETEIERTQEFVLRWSDGKGPLREIVRQQWTFSPRGSTSEVENYQVNLDHVAVLELKLRPELTSGNAVASLAEWRIA
jgi:hypothetical protein